MSARFAVGCCWFAGCTLPQIIICLRCKIYAAGRGVRGGVLS